MKTVLKTTVIFALLLVFVPVNSSADELQTVIDELPSTLKDRYNEACTHIACSWVLGVADTLEQYSKDKDDDRFLMLASMVRSYNAFVNNDSTRFFTNNDITLELADKYKDYDTYFSEGLNRVTFFLNIGRNYSAMKYSRFLVSKAKEYKHPTGLFTGYHSIGNIYEKMGLYHQSLLAFKEADRTLNGLGVEYNDYRNYCRHDIAIENYNLGNYEEAERGCLDLISRNPQDVRSLGVLASVYFKTNRQDKFYECCNKIDTINPASLGNLAQMYSHVKTNIHVQRLAMDGKTEEALKLASTLPYLDYQNHKIDIYIHSDRWKDAFYCLKELNTYYDSLNYAGNENDMREINVEMDHLYKTTQQEKKITALRYHVSIGFLLFLIILGTCTYFIHRNIIISRSNKALAANLDKMLEYKNMLMMKEYATNTEAGNTPVKEHNDKEKKTSEEKNEFDDVTKYIYELTTRHLFTNPDFDRNALLVELNIHRSNFFMDFERQTGLSISKYILKQRMEYAAQLIKNNPEYTLEAIASDSGILSRTTFYRNFTTYFGITPSAYRNEHGAES
ncbi:MAG: helix-turn-helix transcriptional regulator [Bacteroidaceae bacterium]|nr:helix-turn-helix transcriptional regulator [Bacteroidaceae bacterium]